MTKIELQSALAEATQTDKRTAGVFLDTLGALAYKEIKKNGEFVLPGFGKLVKQKRSDDQPTDGRRFHSRAVLHLYDLHEGNAESLMGMSQLSAWKILSERYPKAFPEICSRASLK